MISRELIQCRPPWRTAAGLPLFAIFFFLSHPVTAEAHVKWFSEFSYADEPLSIREVLTPAFFLLLGLAVVVSVTLTLLEEKVTRIRWVAKIDEWFASKNQYTMFVMRLGVGVTLVWCWQAGKFLAPDLAGTAEWMIWLQFLVAFLLVFNRTVAWAGAGILMLYLLAILHYGFFHMLDYLIYAGIGWFFIAYESKKENVRITALPAVYATLGFCLIWLGIEKLIYPSWSKLLLEEHPVLALGVDHDFFVTAAAMIEIGLGFMIMVCLQERLLALFITLLFVLTTMVFGREEVVGHTLIHTVLIVFLFAGPGEATPPLHWIKEMKLRIPATALAFMLLLTTLMIPYAYGSSIIFQGEIRATQDKQGKLFEIEEGREPPRLAIAIHKDSLKGWNLELITENFIFTPEAAGLGPVSGEGHAHLFINGKKIARIYHNWHHLPNLPAGSHEITVTLNANNHARLAVKESRFGHPPKSMCCQLRSESLIRNNPLTRLRPFRRSSDIDKQGIDPAPGAD